MKNMRKLFVPLAVRKNAAGNAAEHLAIEQVSAMYTTLAKYRGYYRPHLEPDAQPTGHAQYMAAGGPEGLQWARKELRQAGILKALDTGDIAVPEAIDFLFGPDLYAVTSKLSVAKVADVFAEAELPAAVVATPTGGSMAVFSANVSAYSKRGGSKHVPHLQLHVYDTEIKKSWVVEQCSVFGQNAPDWKNGIVIHDGITKAGSNGMSMFNSYSVPETFAIGDTTFDATYLLRTGDRFDYHTDVVKVDSEHGVVMGWAIVCKIRGEEYYDTQDDHLTEDCMFGAAVDYMEKSRNSSKMHVHTRNAAGRRVPAMDGQTLFALPLTEDVKKALNIECPYTGLAVGVKPSDEETLNKFKSGEYTGFSIGGHYIPEFIEEVD